MIHSGYIYTWYDTRMWFTSWPINSLAMIQSEIWDCMWLYLTDPDPYFFYHFQFIKSCFNIAQCCSFLHWFSYNVFYYACYYIFRLLWRQIQGQVSKHRKDLYGVSLGSDTPAETAVIWNIILFTNILLRLSLHIRQTKHHIYQRFIT